MNNRKVIVLGASPDPARYSFRATQRLISAGFEPIPLGIKKGAIEGIQISENWPLDEVYAITLYLNHTNQLAFYDRILSYNNTKVIFNPGAENRELMKLCKAKNIEAVEACSLVLLSLGTF
ncbi:MAG: CoA-binding protein [Flavobacteriales bacterium]|nr:CoA-binding protein [Flavobacteriales bacterium]